MLKIKAEQPLREYVSLSSLPTGAIFIRQIDEGGFCTFFIKTKSSVYSFPCEQENNLCEAVCLNDGTFRVFDHKINVREVRAELTVS